MKPKLVLTLWSVVCMLFCICHTETINAESYTLSVGESVTISQKTYAGGYISNCGLADYLDPHLEWTKNADMSCTITVKSYFDYTATVKLIFLETYEKIYGGRGIYTTYKDITINCKYQAPDPSKKPTKVILPERVQIPVGTNVYVTPTLEPSGAQWSSRSWEKISGDGFRVSNVQNELRGYIYGRSIGRGKAMITVDDDLRDTMIVEVIDPDNPPPKGMLLPNNVEISVGGHATLNPVLSPEKAVTSYTWESNDKTVATVSNGRVVGVKPGTATITVTSANELTATCAVTVVASGGKDDEPEDTTVYAGVIDGHGYVDLGLSVKWAAYDVGSDSLLTIGDRYAWGETEIKSTYERDNYKYFKTDIGNDISGTSYDAAHVKWGGQWRMPTKSESSEFVQKCTFEKCDINGKTGLRVIGPNGNTLFLPEITHWTSTVEPDSGYLWDSDAYAMTWNKKSEATLSTAYRQWGYYIRPVCSLKELPSDKEPSALSLPQTKTMEIYAQDEFKLTIIPSNATTTLYWTSSDTSVVKVTQHGLVTACKVGEATITVKAGNGRTTECLVTVTDIQPKTIEIELSKATVCRGYTFKMLYTTTPSLITVPVKWASSNPSVATVDDSSGQIKALNIGQSTITLSAENGIVGSCILTVVKPSPPEQIVMGNDFSLIRKQDGTLWSVGINGDGQLGNGIMNETTKSYEDRYNTVMSQIADGVTDISAGYYSSFFIRNDGSLWACGSNYSGQIGYGSDDNILTPVQIMQDVVKVSSGYNHTLYLKQDGSLWTCGRNNYGELGDNTRSKKSEPIKVMEDVVTISAGYCSSYLIKKDGSLWACGDNLDGQLGDGTTTSRKSFVKIMDDALGVTGGYECAYIIKKDNSLWACGNNDKGALGDGTFTSRKTPVKIMDDVASVSASKYGDNNYALILKTDGTVWGCGSNGARLGNVVEGSTISTPVKITDNVVSVATTRYSTLFLKPDGTLWGCGSNSYGELSMANNDRKQIPNLTKLMAGKSSPVTLKTSNAGYATFYSSESAYTLPAGLSASVVTDCSNNKLTYRNISGSTVPSGVAVMLTASNKSAATYTLNPTDDDNAYTGTNLLLGSDDATTTSGDGLHYKLSYGPSSDSKLKNVFGWYWGATNGGSFQIDGHRAWLVVPASLAKGTRAFTIDGESTGIEAVRVENEDAYYDLQGRKIGKPNKKGIYIKNGKKYINE